MTDLMFELPECKRKGRFVITEDVVNGDKPRFYPTAVEEKTRVLVGT